MWRLIVQAALCITPTVNVGADTTEIAAASYEGFPAGAFVQINGERDVWKAPAEGHVEIDAAHHKTGKQCLHLLGGEDRTVEFTPADTAARMHQLSFWAERWTRRDPFGFRVDALQNGEWRQVYDGTRDIRVGRSFLTHVTIDLGGESYERFRFVSTAPENAGVLIDDLVLSRPVKMRLVSIEADQRQTPVLIRNEFNPIMRVTVKADGNLEPLTVQSLTITTSGTTDLADVDNIRVVHTSDNAAFRAYQEFDSRFKPEQMFGQVKPPAQTLTFRGERTLHHGENHFWISFKLEDTADLLHSVDAGCLTVRIDGETHEIETPSPPIVQRIGYAVRKSGDDGSRAYRIPGLATTNQGTLIGVYDIRYRSWGDLPGHICVGMSRSTDAGQTWDPMRIIMDMGEHDQYHGNGVGDPSVLVDRETGTIWVAALWSHGNRGWNGSGPGLNPDETGQLLLVRSDDDGLTWSEPINITRQLKKPEWTLLLQGPGNGITLRDGTLVFPAQFQNKGRLPHSTLIYSKDDGDTWRIGTAAHPDTTEAQVVQLVDGSLMINMRNNRAPYRAVAVTNDLGQTWREHPTSVKALPEPGACMASLIQMRTSAPDSRSLLLFSNPAVPDRPRRHMTIKVSADEGMTWPEGNHTLIDEAQSAGYSCLTAIDECTVGILYEGSQAPMTFQKFRLDELLDR